MRCFRCDIDSEKALLFDAISKKGIVKICNNCLKDSPLPLINKNQHKVEEKQERRTVYERMARISGVDFINKKLRQANEEILEKQNNELKKFVAENINTQDAVSKDSNLDLVDNFHWIIMRSRRRKKLTQSQLAEKFQEPVESIELLEKGFFPKNARKLILKLEDYLDVDLLKKDPNSPFYVNPQEKIKEDFVENVQSDEIDFDSIYTKNVTIEDLKNLGESKESEEAIQNDDSGHEEFEKSETIKELDEKLASGELTQEEIDRILFGGNN